MPQFAPVQQGKIKAHCVQDSICTRTIIGASVHRNAGGLPKVKLWGQLMVHVIIYSAVQA